MTNHEFTVDPKPDNESNVENNKMKKVHEEIIIDKGEKSVIEKEFSPETIEIIMDKVQDINKYGTAFSAILRDSGQTKPTSTGKLEFVLENGLLGTSDLRYGKDNKKENWAANVSNKKSGVVFFNIVGRMNISEWGKYSFPLKGNEVSEINKSYYGRTWPEKEINTDIFIIFNIKDFEQDKMLDGNNRYGKGQKNRTYRFGYSNRDINMTVYEQVFGDIKPGSDKFREVALKTKELDDRESNHMKNTIFNDKGDTAPISEYGFSLSYRVPPRLFEGLVISVSGYKNETEKLNEVKKIIFAEEEKYKGKEELLIPIYDINGDLLWPKQMPYNELKKFIYKDDNK